MTQHVPALSKVFAQDYFISSLQAAEVRSITVRSIFEDRLKALATASRRRRV
jgi:hypothetical protein